MKDAYTLEDKIAHYIKLIDESISKAKASENDFEKLHWMQRFYFLTGRLIALQRKAVNEGED